MVNIWIYFYIILVLCKYSKQYLLQKTKHCKNGCHGCTHFFLTILTTLLFGFSNQLFAQASASVSYTIVVTDDMLAGRGNNLDGYPEGSDRFSGSALASVTVRSQEKNSARSNESFLAFETEAGSVYSQELAEEIGHRMTENTPDADVITSREECSYGDYLVVMEFN